jgi:ribosomal subunit interface protein
MRSTITARHTDIPPRLRERVERLLPRIARHARRPQSAEIIFNADHGVKVVEILVSLPGGVTAVARAEAAGFPSALTRAAARLTHQLDGQNGKRLAKRRRVRPRA